MNDFARVTAPGTLRIERLLPGPIERVWSYLTDSQQRGKWLASGAMDLRVGGRVELSFKHSDLSPHAETTPERFKEMEGGVTVRGFITQIDPPRLLSYTWDEASDASEVTFELKPQGTDVLLVVTHRRLANRAEICDVAAGWHTHLDILGDNLHGRTPRPFWSAHTRLEAEYERSIPGQSAVVRVSRDFSVPAERAFDAWIDPRIVSQWLFTTAETKIVRADIDARPGGAFSIVDLRNGEEVEHCGRYLEVERPRRLVFTLQVPKYSEQVDCVAVDIVPTSTGCNLTLTHELSPEWAQQTREGWTMLLETLTQKLV
jgi:uncharacterized protein YndB with AHSA1/START domain